MFLTREVGATIIRGRRTSQPSVLPATTASARRDDGGPATSRSRATRRPCGSSENGSLHVAETVVYDFSGTSASVVQREIVTQESYDAESDRVYELDNVAVDAVQTDVDATITTDGGRASIEVEFPEPQTDTVTLTFDYDVAGAVAETADGLEVRWPVVQGLRATDRHRAGGVERHGRHLAVLPCGACGFEPSLHDVAAGRRVAPDDGAGRLGAR
ncbi:MAG: DUF2207 domain-containing protein [Nocardioidaceae bacterium]